MQAGSSPRKAVEVAVALDVQRGSGKILICKRKADAVLGGYWEFPGEVRSGRGAGGVCVPGGAGGNGGGGAEREGVGDH